MLTVLRTPDDRFGDLPTYTFEPRYAHIDDGDGGELRVHYLDEGPADAAPVLLMHGEPSWSYLYRHMIPPLVAAGHRVIAPDLIGFGRSDKPVDQADYTYARHVHWMAELIFDRLELAGITFFGQDWGGLIGLRLLAAQSDRFARVVIGNTGLPTGHGPASEAFLRWQRFSCESPDFDIGVLINTATVSDLDKAVMDAYDAPFADDSYKAGARVFPSLVPTSPDDPASADNVAAWRVLSAFERPFLVAFSDRDPITRGGDAPFRKKVPGAQGQPHTTVIGGGHFFQEDKGPELADLINDFISRTS